MAQPTHCRGRWLSSLSACPCSSCPARWCSETASLQIKWIIFILDMPQIIRSEIDSIRWDSDNLFKILSPTLGEKLGYFQDIYSLTHLSHCFIRQYKTNFLTKHETDPDSPPLVSFHTIPSRLMLVPGSQGPRDSGSVRQPASAVLEDIWNENFLWILIFFIDKYIHSSIMFLILWRKDYFGWSSIAGKKVFVSTFYSFWVLLTFYFYFDFV